MSNLFDKIFQYLVSMGSILKAKKNSFQNLITAVYTAFRNLFFIKQERSMTGRDSDDRIPIVDLIISMLVSTLILNLIKSQIVDLLGEPLATIIGFALGFLGAYATLKILGLIKKAVLDRKK